LVGQVLTLDGGTSLKETPKAKEPCGYEAMQVFAK
jgi:hypothetical protein